MPDHDGTGPKGKGPMTGTCSGSCILKIPDDPNEPIQGFAGEAGRKVSVGGKPESEKEEFNMPRGDKTGPSGAGPKTGRMKGFCMGFGAPRTSNRSQDFASQGRGGGQGRRTRFSNSGLTGGQRPAGIGYGRGPRGFSTLDPDLTPGSSLEILKAQARHLEEAMDGIKRQIQKLESGTEGNKRV